jgi:Domain of unknown function (DUF4157)
MQRETAGKTAEAERKAGSRSSIRPERSTAQSPHSILQLQQAAGNRVFGQFLRAKLRAGEPNDRSGQEADGIAAKTAPGSVPALVHETLAAPGTSLDTATRATVEPHFGHDFSRIHIHSDARAGESARAAGAEAYAYGSHIVFAPGRYKPGQQAGLGILIHELAHTVQEPAPAGPPLGIGMATDPAERFAEASVRAALSGGHAPGAGGGAAGNRLVRRDTQPGTAASEVAPNVEIPDLTGIQFESKQSDDRVLLLWSKRDLHCLPARGLVFTPRPPLGKPAPTGPVFGVPAAGHAGAYLVKTAQGVGMLVDAGGHAGGAPNVLMPASLSFLQVRLNLTEIDGALLSHTHADHVANIPMLVQREQLTGSIYVWPGWERATAGPLGKVWDALRDPSFTQYGKGPGWQPIAVSARQIAGPGGATGVTRGSLQIAGTRLEFVTSTEKLQRYNQALAAGQTGSKFADAASKLTRVTPVGANYNILVVGDLRGADIKELHNQMGETMFNDFVKDTKVLGGVQHHLGAVNNKADVEGIRILLKAIGPTEEPLTAVVQTDAGKNLDLIEALTAAGVRVVTLGEIDPNQPAKVTFTARGEVRAERASIKEPAATIRDAQRRVIDLTRAADALEKYPDMLMGIGKTTAELAEGLKVEGSRLRVAIEKQQELVTSKLHRTTRIADVDDQLRQNETELGRVAGTESELEDQIGMLARFRTRADEIRSETEKSRRRGEASARLRKLIVEVEPKLAEQYLTEELGQVGLSKREQRRATRRAIGRMRRQAELQAFEPRAPVAFGAAGKGVAVALIVIEIVNMIAPLVTEYIQEREEQKFKDFYTFLKVVAWWQEHGTSVPVVALRGNKEVTDVKELLNSVRKRVWTDLPKERQAPEADLDADIRSAASVEKLYVPDMNTWQNPAPVWDRFRIWVSANVNNYDDYASEFTDVENPAFRHQGAYFTEFNWEILTGKVEGDHVTTVWQPSAELTTIMRATARRVIAGTEAQIEAEKARKQEPASNVPTIGPAGALSEDEPTIGSPEGPVTDTAHFKSGRDKKAYGNYQFKESDPSPPWWTNTEPELLVYRGQRSPRPGYVLVGGGDYDTYAAMRSARVWTYDSRQTIQLPKRTVKPYEIIPTEPDRTPREAYGEAAKLSGKGEFHLYDASHAIYYGEVRFPYWTANTAALFWVKRDDLDIQPRSVAAPQPQAPVPLTPNPQPLAPEAGGKRLGPLGPQTFPGSAPGQPGTQLPGAKWEF